VGFVVVQIAAAVQIAVAVQIAALVVAAEEVPVQIAA